MLETPVSRRGFLKLLGAAFALSGMGTGLGGLVAACDDQNVATNTTATIAPGQSTTTTATPVTNTTASTGPELGRPVRIGLVSARTGAQAVLGKADTWWTSHAATALPDGLVSGDGKSRAIKIFSEDNRSDPGAAAKAAVSLISDARVDILLCSGPPGLVNAAADQAEQRECPCIADFVPWRSFVFDRGGSPGKPFKWTYALAFGVEDLTADFLQMWEQLPTNRTVGLVFADNAYGGLWTDARSGLPPVAAAAGFQCVSPAPYSDPAVDFTPQLEQLKKEGCEICCGAMSLEVFLAFWEQAQANGYQPKIVTIADALVFPQALEALGSGGLHMTTGGLWLNTWPFRDSISGRSAAELAQDYTNATGEQWTAAIGQYAKFEWAVDVFRRMANILDKNDIVARVRTTRLETCAGLIDLTAPVGSLGLAASRHALENVYRAAVCGVQWTAGSTFAYEPRLVANASDPGLPVDGTMDAMEYASSSTKETPPQ